jgi:lysophospholipase L1-like esterase
MKSLLLSIVLVFASVGAHAQKASYDVSPYVPAYHQKRLNTFKAEPHTEGGVIFLGNSIIQFGRWKALLADSAIVNRGIAGDNTFGVLERLDDVIAKHPEKLFIEIGINDIAKNIPDSVIITNVAKIISTVRRGSPHTAIYFISILATNDDVKKEYPGAYHKNNHVVLINSRVKRLSKEMGFVFVDMYQRFVDKKGNLDSRYTDDGLHPNEAGYRRYVQVLKEGKYL